MKWSFLEEENNVICKTVLNTATLSGQLLHRSITGTRLQSERFTFALNHWLNSVEVNNVEVRKEVFEKSVWKL